MATPVPESVSQSEPTSKTDPKPEPDLDITTDVPFPDLTNLYKLAINLYDGEKPFISEYITPFDKDNLDEVSNRDKITPQLVTKVTELLKQHGYSKYNTLLEQPSRERIDNLARSVQAEIDEHYTNVINGLGLTDQYLLTNLKNMRFMHRNMYIKHFAYKCFFLFNYAINGNKETSKKEPIMVSFHKGQSLCQAIFESNRHETLLDNADRFISFKTAEGYKFITDYLESKPSTTNDVIENEYVASIDKNIKFYESLLYNNQHEFVRLQVVDSDILKGKVDFLDLLVVKSLKKIATFYSEEKHASTYKTLLTQYIKKQIRDFKGVNGNFEKLITSANTFLSKGLYLPIKIQTSSDLENHIQTLCNDALYLRNYVLIIIDWLKWVNANGNNESLTTKCINELTRLRISNCYADIQDALNKTFDNINLVKPVLRLADINGLKYVPANITQLRLFIKEKKINDEFKKYIQNLQQKSTASPSINPQTQQLSINSQNVKENLKQERSGDIAQNLYDLEYVINATGYFFEMYNSDPQASSVEPNDSLSYKGKLREAIIKLILELQAAPENKALSDLQKGIRTSRKDLIRKNPLETVTSSELFVTKDNQVIIRNNQATTDKFKSVATNSAAIKKYMDDILPNIFKNATITSS
jgi:hypothetical protein